MKKFCIVDLETNGLDPKKNEIIEIAVVECGLIKKSTSTKIVLLNQYSSLNNADVDDNITSITGITQEMLKRQGIDWGVIINIFDRCDFAIAHNAEFDSSFLKETGRFNDVTLKWYCSMRHIDWASEGVVGRKLCHIGGELGMANPFAHRALPDCLFLFKILEDKGRILNLMKRAELQQCTVKAFKSPFSKKDILKENGYLWNGEEKVWYKDILMTSAKEEAEFLELNIYGRGRFYAKFVKVKTFHWKAK